MSDQSKIPEVVQVGDYLCTQVANGRWRLEAGSGLRFSSHVEELLLNEIVRLRSTHSDEIVATDD